MTFKLKYIYFNIKKKINMKLKKIVYGLYMAFIKNDQNYKYIIAERLSNIIYKKSFFSEYWKFWHNDKKFILKYREFEWLNNHSIDRKMVIKNFIKYINCIKWDVVECWSYKWATSWFILDNLNWNKKLHVFDSFEWLSIPNTEDWIYWKKWNLTSSEDIIRNNLKVFTNVEYYKWWIPERFKDFKEDSISFIHIDVDLYNPTYDSIKYFYPLLNKWWIMICDDYWFITCPWARKAMNELWKEFNFNIIELPTWQWLVIKQ